MEDVKNALRVLAKDRPAALAVFEEQWTRIIKIFATKRGKGLYPLLAEVATKLAAIPLKKQLKDARQVLLHGEIFVRREYFACQDLLDRLERREIVVKRAHMFEWLSYCDFNVEEGIYEASFNLRESLEFKLKLHLQRTYEKKIKAALARSGLYEYELVDMKKIIGMGKNFFDVRFTGETILVVGCFFTDILHSVQGVVSIGPFACMPTRVIESVLSAESTLETKLRIDPHAQEQAKNLKGVTALPFLSIESDGNPFPQIIEARIEAFCLQVERLHGKMRSAKGS
jgi:predicted nucleotide-binding protein (sugar kinase/HSP70/actin superfamily)